MVTALGKEATRCLKPFSVGLRRQVVGKEHQAFNETALLQRPTGRNPCCNSPRVRINPSPEEFIEISFEGELTL